MHRLYYIMLFICIAVVTLHIWGALYPSHENWGFHFFGFYHHLPALMLLIFLIIVFIPKIGDYFIRTFDRLLQPFRRLPLLINFILASGLLIGIIYFFGAKLHLLGDGAILLRSVPQGISGDEITLSFRNQPLMFWIYRVAMTFHPFEALPHSYTVYYTIDIVAALGFLALVFWSMQRLQRPFIEKVFLGCFLIFAAGSQFFFGYVENYVLQYVTTAAYVITGWFTLERRVSIIVPIVCFILMVSLHLGDLVFLPSLILIIILKWKKNKIPAFVFLTVIGILGSALMYYMGFNLIDMTRHLKSGTVDFLKPFSAGGGVYPYPMFSLDHLLDWFNMTMLIAPFGIFITFILIPTLPPDRRWKNPILLFLMLATACGIFFTWVINSALGLARDWDLFASFLVPLIIMPIYLLSQPIEFQRRRNIIFTIAVITLFHSAPWIGINSSAERHLKRMQILNSQKLLSKAAQMSYNESLANFFFDSGRYDDARIYYEHYMKIDSGNPRIIGNIADVFRKLGERDKYFYMLKRAVTINSLDPGIYSNLGVEYASRGDTTAAIEFNEKAVKMNPAMQKAHANLGILYSSKKNLALADLHFTTAINLGMREPLLFRYAGDAALSLNDYARAIQYYDIYLGTKPGDQKVRATRNMIYRVWVESKKPK